MPITLSPKLEQLVNEQVQSGRYSTPEEVLTEAVRLLDERMRRFEERLSAETDQH